MKNIIDIYNDNAKHFRLVAVGDALCHANLYRACKNTGYAHILSDYKLNKNDLNFYNQESNYKPTKRLVLRRWIEEVIRREGYQAGEINYVFCSSDYHRQMNRDFLGHDYYTDVITFEERESRVEEGIINGEVYIDVATVTDNASLYNSLPINEMRRVIVHGALHLCGHRDKAPTAERNMRRMENKYLKLLREEML